jgi:hypothetical protein
MKKLLSVCAAALVMVAATIGLMSFGSFNEKVKGNGNIKTEERSASQFQSISTSGIYKVIIEQGNSYKVSVETDENLMSYIETNFSGGDLEIKTKKGYELKPSDGVIVHVMMKEVKSLSASGASGFTSKGTISGDKLKIGTSGAANTDLDLKVRDVKVGISGASHVLLKGSAAHAEFGVSGSGEVKALDFAVEDAEVGISGSGRVDVTVNKNLKAGVSGAGHVKYRGEANVSSSISGAGRVTKI